MTDNVNHPKHYTSGFSFKQPECIDFTSCMDFCRGNAFKYVWRCGLKGDNDKAIEDLNKAKWYIDHSHMQKPCFFLIVLGIFKFSTSKYFKQRVEVLFDMIQRDVPTSLKYQALEAIVKEHDNTARALIDKMIKEIEVSK